MTKIQKLKIIILLFALYFLFSGTLVHAAELFFEAKGQEFRQGEEFLASIFLNSLEESINAVEGKIFFPDNLLELKELRDGNSIINFWIDPVRSCASNGVEKPDAICFSGITPGGFQGNNGLLFSMVFEARNEGVAKFEINDARVLRNDGAGSAATLTTVPFEVVVSEGAPAEIPVIPKIRDRERPESFVPEIAKDETLFDGKWFVVFATQDKVSGIAGYAVHESRRMKTRIATNAWEEAESPYVLKDQNLRSFIYVKAVDKAGNERIAVVEPRYPIKWYEVWWIWFIIGLGIIATYFISRILWIKKLQRR